MSNKKSSNNHSNIWACIFWWKTTKVPSEINENTPFNGKPDQASKKINSSTSVFNNPGRYDSDSDSNPSQEIATPGHLHLSGDINFGSSDTENKDTSYGTSVLSNGIGSPL